LKPFISSSIYRNFLSMLASSGLRLADTVNLTIDGVARDFTVLHKIELTDFSTSEAANKGLIEPLMHITSWAIVPIDGVKEEEQKNFERIDPEREWVDHGCFWVGAINKVYRDVTAVVDKKLSGFGWCGNTERELAFPGFFLVKEGPLFTIQVRLSCLQLFTLPTTVVPGAGSNTVKVGSVDESGVVTPDSTSIATVLAPAVEPVAEVEEQRVPAMLTEKGAQQEDGGFFGGMRRLLAGNEPAPA
jgi:hypothetical protein